ncbi:MAG: type III-B CRISPR module RAMP protein Cmr1 [Armatimonadetes bacterium]|nr:type III-B CRISPR module RAMP protein Cmr1 [Armatimonadota bacterium]
MPRNAPSPPTWHEPQVEETITLHLRLITPMFGGGYEPRKVDTESPIRAASIRGHLRFWWRATAGAQYAHDHRRLFEEETKLWGSMETPGKVGIGVDVSGRPTVQTDEPAMQAPDAYALWPARSPRGDNPKPPAQRIQQGLQFRLGIGCPTALLPEVRTALKAWITFGGIGGRTRRGCGALGVVKAMHGDHEEPIGSWMPTAASADALQALFDGLALQGPVPAATAVPSLAGSHVYADQRKHDALQAWYEALRWLREFRQGHAYPAGDRAREPDPTGGNRPSISNWPEADKVRCILGKPPRMAWAHQPRHNATPAWPRAGLGLPIVGQFQQQDRTRRRWQDSGEFEPRGFEIIWRDTGGAERDRLASPLIIKPLALADGQYVACAIWLNRAYPHGEACLKGQRGSGARFSTLVAGGDTARFAPLGAAPTLRDAFFGWVAANFGARRILP